MIQQRDIVEVPFNLQQGAEPHPVIVLSCNDAIEQEGGSFMGLMLTTSKIEDEFTFEITSDMLTKKLDVSYCQARVHLISYFKSSHIIPTSHFNNRIKEEYFKRLIRHMQINGLKLR